MTTSTGLRDRAEKFLALAEKATPGPWQHSPWHIEEGEPAVRGGPTQHIVATFAGDDDAAFTAAAKTDAPDIIRALLASPADWRLQAAEYHEHQAALWDTREYGARETAEHEKLACEYRAMIAASPAAGAEGWVLVPREPTQAMLANGAAQVRNFTGENGQYPRTKAMWSAMLAEARELVERLKQASDDNVTIDRDCLRELYDMAQSSEMRCPTRSLARRLRISAVFKAAADAVGEEQLWIKAAEEF